MQLFSLQQQFFSRLFSREKDYLPFNEKRFNLYRQSVYGHLLKCLHDIYPICLKLLGEQCFNAIAERYLLEPQFLRADINLFGDQFFNFLTGISELKNLVYLPDMAQLEWLEYLSFNAENNRKITLAQWQNFLQKKDATQLILKKPNNSFLFQSLFPIHRIWQMNQEDNPDNDHVNLQEGSVRLLIWRDDLTFKLDVLTENEWQILNFFKHPKRLLEILAELEQRNLDAVAHLTKMIQKGWLEI